MTNPTMTCEAFDAELPDYFEGTLDGQMSARVDQHLRECVRCASLIRDLQTIRKEASALPDLVPSRDLWSGIEARIAAPVIPLVARPITQRRLVPAWIGIAAAAQVVTTAALTYTLTARSVASRYSNVAPSAAAGTPQTSGPLATVASAESGHAKGESAPDNSAPGSSGAKLVQSDAVRSRATIPASVVSQTTEVAPSYSEIVYGKEIAMLQAILNQKKTRLDPSTVVVIARNLQIIDAAIEKSKAALAKDPASMLLSQQLSHALDKKVELLRTAALLPANT
jgi:hypothetical protein